MSLEEMREFMGATASPSCPLTASTASVGFDHRDSRSPQFTDHCFTGEYPTELTDKNGPSSNSPRQLSLLAEAR